MRMHTYEPVCCGGYGFVGEKRKIWIFFLFGAGQNRSITMEIPRTMSVYMGLRTYSFIEISIFRRRPNYSRDSTNSML